MAVDGDPRRLAAPAVDALRRLDDALAVSRIETGEQLLDDSVASRRYALSLVAAFAALALALAAVGLYGVLALRVAERRRELGIRQALGARRADLVRLVLGRGLALVAVGLAVGLAASAALARLLASALYQIHPLDLPTFATVPLALLAAAVLASYLPARRAGRVAPAEALRDG